MKKKYLWYFLIFFGELRLHFSKFSAMGVIALSRIL